MHTDAIRGIWKIQFYNFAAMQKKNIIVNVYDVIGGDGVARYSFILQIFTRTDEFEWNWIVFRVDWAYLFVKKWQRQIRNCVIFDDFCYSKVDTFSPSSSYLYYDERGGIYPSLFLSCCFVVPTCTNVDESFTTLLRWEFSHHDLIFNWYFSSAATAQFCVFWVSTRRDDLF